MANDPSLDPVSEAEVQAVAAKLLAWGQRLTPREQALLGPLLDPAALLQQTEAEVSGYADLTGLGSPLAGASSPLTSPLSSPVGDLSDQSLGHYCRRYCRRSCRRACRRACRR